MGKSSKAEQKTQRGRPTKYGPEVAQTACKLAEMFGATDEQLCKILHVAGSTLALWVAEHEEFSEALKRAKESHDSGRVKTSLLQSALGYYYQNEVFHPHTGEVTRLWKYQPASLGAQVFWLANRQKETWRSIKGGIPELPEVQSEPEMSDSERSAMQKLAAEYLQQNHKTRLMLTTEGRN